MAGSSAAEREAMGARGRRSSWDRIKDFYYSLHEPTRENLRDRAIHGDRNLGIALSEYDALRNQPPGVTLMLRPMAFPNALGLASFFMGTWYFTTWYNAWWGAGQFLGWFPLLFALGSLGQLFAAHRAIKARDNWASVFFGTWGSFYFWFAFFLWFAAIGRFPWAGEKYVEFDTIGFVLIPVFVLTCFCLLTALARDLVLVLMTLCMATSACVMFIGFFVGNIAVIKIGSYIGWAGSLFALYRLLGYLVEETWLHRFIPMFRFPWESRKYLVKVPIGEPGVQMGQY